MKNIERTVQSPVSSIRLSIGQPIGVAGCHALLLLLLVGCPASDNGLTVGEVDGSSAPDGAGLGGAGGGGRTGVGGAGGAIGGGTGGSVGAGGVSGAGGTTVVDAGRETGGGDGGGTNPGTCGGMTCGADSYCEFPAGTCSGSGGVCVKKGPRACGAVFDPVCGCDGKTYGNDCDRSNASVSQRSVGACRPDGGVSPDLRNDGPPDAPPGAMCGGIAGFKCPAGQYCRFVPGECVSIADAAGNCALTPEVCTADSMPVCGCDRKTYGNPCEAARQGVSVGTQGRCAP